MTEFELFTLKGWQCPVCGRVYSPSFPWCVFCGDGEKRVITTTDTLVTNTGSVWPSEGWYMDIINEALKSTKKEEDK